jgi:hypothetical protein
MNMTTILAIFIGTAVSAGLAALAFSYLGDYLAKREHEASATFKAV